MEISNKNFFFTCFQQVHFHKKQAIKTVVSTVALFVFTRLSIKFLQKMTKKQITPFKGNQRATLAYSAASVASFAASMAVLAPITKQPRQDLQINPFRPILDESQEDQEVAIISERQTLDPPEDANLQELCQGDQQISIDLASRNISSLRSSLNARNVHAQNSGFPVQRRERITSSCIQTVLGLDSVHICQASIDFFNKRGSSLSLIEKSPRLNNGIISLSCQPKFLQKITATHSDIMRWMKIEPIDETRHPLNEECFVNPSNTMGNSLVIGNKKQSIILDLSNPDFTRGLNRLMRYNRRYLERIFTSLFLPLMQFRQRDQHYKASFKLHFEVGVRQTQRLSIKTHTPALLSSSRVSRYLEIRASENVLFKRYATIGYSPQKGYSVDVIHPYQEEAPLQNSTHSLCYLGLIDEIVSFFCNSTVIETKPKKPPSFLLDSDSHLSFHESILKSFRCYADHCADKSEIILTEVDGVETLHLLDDRPVNKIRDSFTKQEEEVYNKFTVPTYMMVLYVFSVEKNPKTAESLKNELKKQLFNYIGYLILGKDPNFGDKDKELDEKSYELFKLWEDKLKAYFKDDIPTEVLVDKILREFPHKEEDLRIFRDYFITKKNDTPIVIFGERETTVKAQEKFMQLFLNKSCLRFPIRDIVLYTFRPKINSLGIKDVISNFNCFLTSLGHRILHVFKIHLYCVHLFKDRVKFNLAKTEKNLSLVGSSSQYLIRNDHQSDCYDLFLQYKIYYLDQNRFKTKKKLRIQNYTQTN